MADGVAAGMIAAALAVSAAPAPAPAPPRASISRGDICAVLARAETPGSDETADPARRARAGEILRTGAWQGVRWRYDRRRRVAVGGWGRCTGRVGGAQSLACSADGRHAKTEGGYQAAPLHGGWGHCIFEKSAAGTWELVACEVTMVS